LHLGFLQQMCGANVVILYGGKILNDAVPGYGNLMQIFLISMMIFTCILCAYVLKKVGRKTLLQLGTLVSIILLIILGTAYLEVFNINGQLSTSQQIMIVVSLYIFMTSFGLTLGPVVWLYIPEIVQPNIVAFATLSNWTGGSLTIILFPILGGILGKSILFYFLAAWCLGSLLFNHKFVV
jgi:SP family sugar:H+ symporter-like MFS transporter